MNLWIAEIAIRPCTRITDITAINVLMDVERKFNEY